MPHYVPITEWQRREEEKPKKEIHPNSMENLKKGQAFRVGKPQPYTTALAGNLNWMKSRLAANAGLGVQVRQLMEDRVNWNKLHPDRQDKIMVLLVELEILQKTVNDCINIINRIPYTPIESEDARRARLDARNKRQKARRSSSPA